MTTTTTGRTSRFAAPSVWLGAFALTFWVCHTMLRPLVGPYAQSLGLSASTIGIVIGIQAVPAVLFAIPLGSALDRSSARRILASGAALMCVGGALLVFATNVATLVASQVIIGFGTLAVWLTIQSLVTFAAPDPQRRSRSIANYSVCIVTGQLLGPLVGGLLAEAWGYNLTFGAFAVLSLALLTGTYARYADRDFTGDVAPSPATTARRSSFRDAAGLLREHGVALTVTVSFLALFLVDLRTAFVPVFLTERGWSPGLVGMLLSTSSACALLARPIFPSLVARFGNATVVVFCLLPGAAALGSLVLVDTTGSLFVLAGIAGIALGLAQPLTLTLTADFTGPAQRGLAVALRVLTNRLALWLSPMLFGLLVTVLGMSAAFLVGTGILALVASIIAWRFARLPDRPH